jgi:hypothetical protein
MIKVFCTRNNSQSSINIEVGHGRLFILKEKRESKLKKTLKNACEIKRSCTCTLRETHTVSLTKRKR